jgi:hypothetical protein
MANSTVFSEGWKRLASATLVVVFSEPCERWVAITFEKLNDFAHIVCIIIDNIIFFAFWDISYRRRS